MRGIKSMGFTMLCTCVRGLNLLPEQSFYEAWPGGAVVVSMSQAPRWPIATSHDDTIVAAEHTEAITTSNPDKEE